MKLGALAIAGLASSIANAAPPQIVAIAGAPATALVIDSAGAVYAPDGKGAWIARSDGAVAGDVVAAAHTGDAIFVGVANAPPFELLPHGGWSVMNLGLHAVAMLGRGERTVAAVGRGVFALERGKATKLAEAATPVELVGASAKAITVQTDRGLARWDGTKWTPLAKSPHRVDALLDATWALVNAGVIDLDTGKLVAWPLGFHVQAALADGETVYAASARELITLAHGAFTREPLPALASPIAGLVADRGGRIAIATRGGQLARRVAGAWTVVELRSEPAVAHAGSPPAESK
ncbi:MAG TPA: hypothetical protein VH143_07940 [Kofleriaceae bacterium]|nr:hypothetical protein [Kofleriaceae bacterium]